VIAALLKMQLTHIIQSTNMKLLSTSVFLLCFLLCTAQDYSYAITSEQGDSTFQLDVITVVNASRSNIARTFGLDTASLQIRQYAEINALYERWARALRDIDNYKRAINNLKNSLDSVGEAYNDWAGEQQDSSWQGIWVYRDQNLVSTECFPALRDNLGPFLRRTSDNVRIFTIRPRSRNYIQVNWNTSEGYGNGDTSTILYSVNGRFYVGEDASGGRHVFRFKRS